MQKLLKLRQVNAMALKSYEFCRISGFWQSDERFKTFVRLFFKRSLFCCRFFYQMTRIAASDAVEYVDSPVFATALLDASCLPPFVDL